MENEYHLASARRAAGDTDHCLLVLHNSDGKHVNFHVSLQKLNEVLSRLNEGADDE